MGYKAPVKEVNFGISYELELSLARELVDNSGINYDYPDAGASCASRQAMVSGNAVLAAADEIRDTLLTLAARKIKTAKDRLDLRNGRLLVDGEVHDLTVKNLAERASVWGYPLHAQSRYHLEYPDDAPEVTYRFSSEFFQFCTQIAQVLVDCETGQVTVEKLVAVHDAGKIINPGGVFGHSVDYKELS